MDPNTEREGPNWPEPSPLAQGLFGWLLAAFLLCLIGGILT